MFRKITISFMLVAFLAVGANADTWNFDTAHSSVGFTVKHMVISKVKGTFTQYDGSVEFDGKNFETGSVNVAIDVVSVDTDNEKRDNHLKTSDFFDLENHPKMTFISKKVVKGDGDNFEVLGDLTLRGVTKEVTLDAE